MKNLNRWQGIGRLGQDPDIRTTPSGQTVATFNLACQDDYQDQHGQKIERTEWIRIVIWGKAAEVFARYTHKGSRVYIEGKLTTRKWQDKNGNDRYVTEVLAEHFEFLDGKPAEVTAGPSSPRQSRPERGAVPSSATPPSDFDDDIPF